MWNSVQIESRRLQSDYSVNVPSVSFDDIPPSALTMLSDQDLPHLHDSCGTLGLVVGLRLGYLLGGYFRERNKPLRDESRPLREPPQKGRLSFRLRVMITVQAKFWVGPSEKPPCLSGVE